MVEKRRLSNVRSSSKPRQQERRAVNAAQSFFEDHDLIFQEIDLRNDVGKDVILDLARSGKDAGLSIALQIKGGRKYKRKVGHAIPIDPRLRSVWRNSSLPVFVIVRDPDDSQLYWGNLSAMAEGASDEVRTVTVVPDICLTRDGLEGFLKAARHECLARRSDPLLNLTSAEPSVLQSSLFDCLAAGRRDPRYLQVLRTALLYMKDQYSFCSAIHVLAHATSHPDIFWHEDNIIPEDIRKEVRKSFRWPPNEIAMLLARLPKEEGMWGRGTIGQSLYHLLISDPSLEWSVDRLLTEAFRADNMTWQSSWINGPPFGPSWVNSNRDAVILPCLTLSLYMAADPKERLEELVERLPPIREIKIFSEIAEIIMEFGYIDIF